MKKILLAGSTGFVGSKLKAKLLADYKAIYSVKTLDREGGDFSFADLESCTEDFDYLIYLSAALPNKDLNSDDYQKANYELAKKVFSQFQNSKIVFSSTISVYENSSKKPCQEEDLGEGLSDYAQSKLDAESLLQDYNSIALRLSSIYGPGMKVNSFLPIVIESALKKKEITLIGDTKRKQNYTHVDDVVSFLIQALNDQQGIFNAVAPKSYSNQELAELVLKFLPETEIKHQEATQAAYSFEISSKKWFNSFGTKAEIDLEQGIKDYIDRCKKF